jgi:hypothetical protein
MPAIALEASSFPKASTKTGCVNGIKGVNLYNIIKTLFSEGT